MSQTAFLSPNYLPGEDEIAAIEERLMTAQGPDWFHWASVMAWYCRQEPSDRPLDLVARIQDLLPGSGLAAREEAAIRLRLDLVRGEIACTRSELRDADRLFRSAIAAAESLGDTIAYGDALCGLGLTLRMTNAVKEAKDCMAAARSAYMTAGDRNRAAFSYFVLAATEAHDNAGKALAKYGTALATEEQESDPALGPYVKAYLSRCAVFRGDLGAAIRLRMEGRALALKSRQYFQAAVILMLLGESFFSLNDYDAALDYFNQAVEMGRSLRSRFLVSMNLSHMAEVMRVLGRPRPAREFLEMTLQNWQHEEQSRWYVLRMIYLAEVTLDLGEAEAALKIFDDAIRHVGSVGVVSPLDRALTGKARALLALDRLDEARSAAEQALLIGQETAAAPNRIEAMRISARILSQRGRFDEALATYANAESIAAGIEGYALSAELFNELGSIHSACSDFKQAYHYAMKAQAAAASTRLKEEGNRLIASQIRHESERARMDAAHQPGPADIELTRFAPAVGF